MNSYITHGILSICPSISLYQEASTKYKPDLFWRYQNSLFYSEDHYFITTQQENDPFSLTLLYLPSESEYATLYMTASLAKKNCSPHCFRESCPLRLTIPRSQLTHRAVSLCLERTMLTHSEEQGKHDPTWGGWWRLSLTPTNAETSPKILQMCNTAVFVFVWIVVGTNQGGSTVPVPRGFQ